IRVLGFVSRWPRVTIALVIVFCVVGLTRLPKGGEFLPEFREGHFVVQIIAAPGTSLGEMTRIGTRLSAELLSNTNIDSVEQQVGRAELGEDPWGPQRCELHIELRRLRAEEEEKMKGFLEDTLKKFPGIQFEVLTFLGDRISETISGETQPVVVNIFGDDLDVLDAKAQEVAAVLNSVPGH